MNKYLKLIVLMAVAAMPLRVAAQDPEGVTQSSGLQSDEARVAAGPIYLTIEDCRDAAIRANKDLDEAQIKVDMAGYDRKIAFANYFPSISATGAYLHNNRHLDLLPEEIDNTLTALPGAVQGSYNQFVSGIEQRLTADPAVAQVISSSPQIMQFLQGLRAVDLQTPISGVTDKVTGYFDLDIENVYFGALTLQQPLFVGGKIVYSNQMAALAEQLTLAQYDQKYAETIVAVDQAYWQVVSVASKRRLAEAYADLLHTLERDVEISVKAGVATKSDALQIKVKANEADIMLTKATNGLALSKMLLCKETGLPLDSEIILADENLDAIPVPDMGEEKSLEDIYASRPETKSLDLAVRIYDKKAGIARADMMPKVLLLANYLVSNPNAYHGFQNSWRGGTFSAGVVVNIPIFHGFEALQKARKAKAEAALYRDKLDDARNLINLQVTRDRKLLEEALQKLEMCEDSLDAAEENLRTAMVGFEAGVVETSTVLMAQTAWLQAHSAYLDAGVELQMAATAVSQAEGNIVPVTNEQEK